MFKIIHKYNDIWWALYCCVLIFLDTGCAWIDQNGTKHHLILGLGYFSEAKIDGMVANDLAVAGLTYDNGISLGLVRSYRVEIDPSLDINILTSIKTDPFSLEIKHIKDHNH
ncbi:hypothetical protein [Methylomonas rosea]|uniref:Uncharacterized protein n=1 Tax=Methylomonas rosea TaxID=2952227 RepID=A0ABT1TQB6_9GAMM|nr:hypothetical protein [Methylomonas sp. WSC-7]MCQ8116672.1 hypothetical protein [Methylomonas sp. WSC-7]